MNKSYCKLPQHFIAEMALKGNIKYIALLSSLKVAYKDGFIPNYRKVKTSELGYKITKRTYLSYINKLQQLGFVKSNNKGGLFLIGQNSILKLYPCKKPTYIYLEDTKELKEQFELIATYNNIKQQEYKQKKLQQANVKCKTEKVSKKVNGVRVNCNVQLEFETSLSCMKQAKLIGLKTAMSGRNRRLNFEAKNYIKTTKRCIFLGELSREIVKEYRSNKNWTLRFHKGNWYRILANEFEILKTIGKKIINDNSKQKLSFVNNELFNQYW